MIFAPQGLHASIVCMIFSPSMTVFRATLHDGVLGSIGGSLISIGSDELLLLLMPMSNEGSSFNTTLSPLSLTPAKCFRARELNELRKKVRFPRDAVLSLCTTRDAF
jgi:hypothetical protein